MTAEIKYVVCYLGGNLESGVEDEWIAVHDMEEAIENVHYLQRHREFGTITIAEIKESYECGQD